jgi:iron complex outermembrane receptor protein
MTRTRINSKMSLAALAVASAFAPAAHAQDQKMTEVVITANRVVADRASVAGFSEQPLLQTPASVSVITREQLQELSIRNTTDAAKYDASIGDAYNAVGYAEQFSIRGYKLDNASSYSRTAMRFRVMPRSRWKTRKASKCCAAWPGCRLAWRRRAAWSTT